jgi:hypothetical protein
VPAPTIKDVIASRHRSYLHNCQFFQYFHDAYQGGPEYPMKVNPILRPLIGFSTDPQRAGANRYVTMHPLEDTSAYLNRLYRACPVNICGPAVDMLAGTVGSPDTLIVTVDKDYQPMIEDADTTGNSYSQFMTLARTHAAIFGHTFILTDSTRSAGQIMTQADVIAQGIRPYFIEITPQHMLNWRLDGRGKPLEILFRVAIEPANSILTAIATGEQPYEYHYWSLTDWQVYREDGGTFSMVDSGPNPLGEIPISVLYHKRKHHFCGDSMIKESAKYTQLLSNWLSDLDQTMETQSFAQACLRSENPPSQVAVGATKIIHLHPSKKSSDGTSDVGEADFFYRSPESAPIETMWNAFFRIIDMANESMSLNPDAVADKSHPESGISRAWRWHSTEKRLTQMAIAEQECARNMFYFAAKWMGQKDFTGSIVYGHEFDLTALSDDIQNMLQLQAMNMPQPVQAEMKSRIVSKAMPNLPPDKQNQFAAAIKAQDQVTQLEDRRMITDSLNQA